MGSDSSAPLDVGWNGIISHLRRACGEACVKRCLDIVLAGTALLLLGLPMLIIALMVKLTSPGPALYWSDRVGQRNRVFRMPKFRTMHVGTPEVATHLLNEHVRFVTPVGHFLRTTSLDELPQFLAILHGDMSIVGPRPALFNQADLISLRTAKGVDVLVPGLTGWAQVMGRDELPIPRKVQFDEFYLQNRSTLLDLKIILLTVRGVLSRQGVSH